MIFRFCRRVTLLGPMRPPRGRARLSRQRNHFLCRPPPCFPPRSSNPPHHLRPQNPGFSAEALHQRIDDSRPKCVFTMSAVKRGAKPIALKSIVDDALKLAKRDGIEARGAGWMPFALSCSGSGDAGNAPVDMRE